VGKNIVGDPSLMRWFPTYFSSRLASTVFHHYIASDDASESLAGLKRIHGFMPYFMLKAALKISNPVAMIRSAPSLVIAVSVYKCGLYRHS
jgi:hypothetical protein